MKINKLLYILLAVSLFTNCVKDDDDETVEYVKVGDTVPVFTVSGEDSIYSSTNTSGKITLICFFTTWCPNCHNELPKIEYVWEELQGESDFGLVTIGREETLATIAGFWTESGFTMPYYEDPNRSVYAQFASATIPRFYIIGRDKTIREIIVGDTTLTQAQWLTKIKSYLETP